MKATKNMCACLACNLVETALSLALRNGYFLRRGLPTIATEGDGRAAATKARSVASSGLSTWGAGALNPNTAQ
jgi:hypothetical protein